RRPAGRCGCRQRIVGVRSWSSRPWLSLSHCGGGVHHGGHDLFVAGATAEGSGEPVADFGLRRIVVALEQGLGGHEEARGADPALQSRVLEESLLQRMERLALGHALDGLHLAAVHLAAEDEAGADEAAVQHDAARAAVAGGAAFLATREMQGVAQNVEERLLRLAEVLDLVTVDLCVDVMLGHQFALARSSAMRAARRVSTAATSTRKSTVPRLSSMGRHAAPAAASSRACAASSSPLPMMACAAFVTRSTRAATAPRPTRAVVMMPLASTVRLTPAPTTAISISVRGMKRR